MSGAGRVGPVARALGFAGLLPQVAAVVVLFAAKWQPSDLSGLVDIAAVLALFYPLSILSFLGGMWWGLGMQAHVDQAVAVTLAIVPALTALALLAMLAAVQRADATLVATGSAIALTLFVDRWLARRGTAPAGWMRLRVPLSLGLGGLTILAGLLILSGIHGVRF